MNKEEEGEEEKTNTMPEDIRSNSIALCIIRVCVQVCCVVYIHSIIRAVEHDVPHADENVNLFRRSGKKLNKSR